MILPTSVVVLLVILLPESVFVQHLSEDEENKWIEVQNNCKCVKHYLCNDNNYIDTDGVTVIRRRHTAPAPKIECKGAAFPYEIICCKLNNSNSGTEKTIVGPRRDQTSRPGNCGTSRTAVEPRIVNIGDEDDGLTAQRGDFPWIAAIFNKTWNGNFQFVCGGSLIHPRVVLTAYHCIYRKRPSDLVVVVNGKLRVSADKEEDRRSITEIISHPKYAHTGRLYNDAALLILNRPFPVNEDLNTLCLPPRNVNLQGTNCSVTGWGRDSTGQRSEKLKRVEVPFINRDRCETLLRNTKLGGDFDLHKSFMCAGGEKGKDACIGDGGGPLMCKMPSDGNVYFQAGIVSWGIGCATENVPGVYTDVQRISKWIEEELRDRQLNI